MNAWHIRRAANHRTMAWKNGLGATTELFVEPDAATLANFDWRLSMAHVTADAPFSKFDGVDRLLVVLEGALAMNIEGKARTLTSEDGAVEFSGEAAVSAAPVQRTQTSSTSALDLNLMLRRGKFSGRLLRQVIEPRTTWRPSPKTRALLCRSPSVHISDGSASDVLDVNDLLVLDDPSKSSLQLACDREALIYIVELSLVSP